MPMNQRKFVDVGGIETCYYEAGDGPPLVLLHGGNTGSPDAADCALDWDTNFDALARRYRVFAIDKIGQGYTGNPKTDDGYSMQGVVDHACATLDALGVANAHLVGHSRGGYLTCRMTLERPDLAATCTIVDSNSCAPGVGLNEIVIAGAPKPRLSEACQRWVLEQYSYSNQHITNAWVDALVEIAETPKFQQSVEKMVDQALLHSVFMPGMQRDKEQNFDRIRARGMGRPTLLIWGYNDPTAPLALGRALFDMIALRERRSQFSVINESGHFTYREHPAAFNATLHAFIEGNG